MKSLVSLIVLTTYLSLHSVPGLAADWPTWRHDVSRSGVTEEELPETLYLNWSRQLPAPIIAWPNEPRLQFDAANEPIAMGNLLYVGSCVDGSLRAFDSETGKSRWTFYTEGPIRCAPVAWQGKVYVGSDDGYLYCLNATTGEQLWRVRGAPADRPDYRHLGNARLVSFWPVRGGPVLREGTLYFGAGIWPSMGIFINAVDAKTGKMKWSNGEANYIEQVRLDHNDLQEAGLSPQGYFLFADGTLQVPNGRSMPAGIDPATGRLLHYVQGYRRGDSRVTASGKYLFVGEGGVVRATDGREVGERWVAAGNEAPKKWSTPKLDLFEGPIFGYKFVPGCDFRAVFDSGIAYGVSKGFLFSHDLTKAATSPYEKKKGAQTYHPLKWQAPELWKRLWIAEKPGAQVQCMIKAGNRLYVGLDQYVVVVDVPRKPAIKPRIAGRFKLPAPAASMIAASGKLVVSLADGRMLCFRGTRTSVKKYRSQSKPTAPRKDAASRRAARLLAETRIGEGYAIVLGIDQPDLIEALLDQSQLHVIAVDSDRSKVNSLRQRLTDLKLYGTRAEVFIGDPLTFRFPPYLASLIVANKELAPGISSPAAITHLYQILRPYGGMLWLPLEEADRDRFQKAVSKTALERAELAVGRAAVILHRRGALPGSSDWTHEGSNAARTYYSADDLVRAPLGILWYGDGPGYGFYKRKDYGRGVKPQVAGGRVFAFDDVRQFIGAVDAYTGRLLWTFDTGTDHVRFSSQKDGLYVARNQQCDLLDPATGQSKGTYHCRLRKQEGQTWEVVDIRVADDVILVALGYEVPDGHSHPAVTSGLWDCEALVAIDREDGRQLWVKYPERRYNIHAIAMGGALVFVTDSIAPHQANQLSRRGTLPKTMPSTTYALDARTGKQEWTFQADYDVRDIGRSWQSVRANDDWISYARKTNIVLLGKRSQTIALDAKSGQVRWKKRCGSQPFIVRDETLVNQEGGQYAIATGERVSSAPLFRRSGGCNYAVGNKHLMFIRNRSATYFDVSDHKEYSLRDIRSGCSNSFVAADGLLNMPCFSYGCVCNYPLQTSFAMRYMPESAQWAGEKPFQLRNAEQ